ncbi:protein of unknown function [Mucilaginibacter pineti]|uniref:DUF5018 domain-containing protein n=1 Tax=Mucilaginibacter pineti TaxID=1391627 RepID=A0A1G6XM89_9SPHI|nr:DUF5018 domain-containing protein [Mucilaginibacter pineti]SDD78356.1 protein of unknown function [Mucilaginibacter pineti]
MKWARVSIYTVLAFTVLFIINSCGSGHKADPVPTQIKSSDKNITAFKLSGSGLAITGVITGTTISFTAPAGTDVTALTPAISISAKATVSPNTNVPQDFSKDVNYTVTAEDGSTQVYKVTVTIAKAVTQVIDCANVPAVLEDRGDGVDYIIKCNINISNYKVLTIKPGVTIQFDGEGAGITVVGGSIVGGGLKMVGTKDKPIILEGKTAKAGSWTGIQVNSKNISNQWEYVTVRDAGAGQYAAGVLLDNSNNSPMQVSVKNCSFINNEGYGIWDYENGYAYGISIFSEFANNTFTDNTKSALKIKIGEAGSLDAASSYKNNTQKFIEVTGRLLLNNITVQNIGIPYVIEQVTELNQKMTINSGVAFQFTKDAGFYLGYLDNGGTIIANGTAAAPIKFTGYEANIKGYWFGIELDNSDPQIEFNNCLFDGAGSIKSDTYCSGNTKAALNFGGNCGSALTGGGKVTNCTISNSGGYGINYRAGRSVTLTNNKFSGNTLADILKRN